jgi:DNA-binding beta-propeller fold protein YncE
VDRTLISRRALIGGAATALACSHPKATGYRGFCFVANEAGRSLSVVDLRQFRVRKHIPLESWPSQVIAHPSELKALVLCPESGTVCEIDATKLAVTRKARAGDVATSMQVSPAGDAVWVLTQQPAALVEIPLKSMQPGRRINLQVGGNSFDLNGTRAAIASARERVVTLASIEKGSIERLVRTPGEASLVAFRKDGRHFFTASRLERSFDIFETATGRTVTRLPLPVTPHAIAVKPDGGQVFVSGEGSDAVVVVYVYQTEIAETLLAGRAPAAMAAMDSPAYLMVANPDTNSVTVLDLDNNGRLVASVQVGQSPRSIVITPERPGLDQYALVLNEKSGDLAVIRIKSLPARAEERRRPTPIFALIPVGEKPVSAAVMTFA